MGRVPVNLDSFKVASQLLFFVAVCKLQIWMELFSVSEDKYLCTTIQIPLPLMIYKRRAFFYSVSWYNTVAAKPELTGSAFLQRSALLRDM